MINEVTTLPLGIKWNREDMATSATAKKNFFRSIERPVEYKNSIRRELFPYPWDEVAFNILRYISHEGKLSVVYGYHFRLLHELKYQGDSGGFPRPLKNSCPMVQVQRYGYIGTNRNPKHYSWGNPYI